MFCNLNQKFKNNPIALNCWISGLISGVGYWFYPKYMIFTMAMTNFIESMFCELKSYTELNKNHRLSQVVSFIDKIPVVYILFVVGTSLSVQLRIFYPNLLNKYFHRVVKMITNQRAEYKIENFMKYMMGAKV